MNPKLQLRLQRWHRPMLIETPPMKHCFGRKSSVPPATNAPAAQSAMPASSQVMKRTGKTLPSSHGRLCKFFGLGPIGGGNRQLIVSATGDCRLQQFACPKQAVNTTKAHLSSPCQCRAKPRFSPAGGRCLASAFAAIPLAFALGRPAGRASPRLDYLLPDVQLGPRLEHWLGL